MLSQHGAPIGDPELCDSALVFVVRLLETDQAFREERFWLIRGQSLSGLQSVLQATVCAGSKFYVSAFCEDRRGPAEVDVGRRQVVDALMVVDVIVVLDEGANLSFDIAR